MAAPRIEEGACARAERLEHERLAYMRGVLASGIRDTGATSTCKKYSHGQDCRRMMTEAEYMRDYDGSRAVIVRAERADGSDRVLVHLCGIKAGESCAIQAVYNRIPDSRVSRSDTTDFIQRCYQHPRGYVQGALRDVKTRYQLGKSVAAANVP